MTNPFRWPILAFCLLAISGSGCGPPAAFQIETVIHPDGSCDRMIWQPKEKFLPDQALKPKWNARWKTVADASGRPGGARSWASDDELKYFIARGTFTSPREIPPHYHYADPEVPDAGSSELERTYERKDYGFVVEYRWQEKLTNIVTLPGFMKGRDEVLDMLLPACTDAIERIFGKDYDVSRFVTFIRSDVRRFLENVSIVWYDAAVRGRIGDDHGKLDSAFMNRVFQEVERLGLDPKLVAQASTATPDEQASSQAANALFSRLIVRHFRHRNGNSVTTDEANKLVAAISKNHLYEGAIREQTKRMNDLFTGEDQKRFKRALIRMMGLYPSLSFLFAGGAPEYDFTIVLPGEIIESNGTGLRAGRTRWKFNGAETFPDGYDMKARSIWIDRDGQQKILGRVVIDDEAKAMEFMELAGSEGPLMEALRALRRTGDRNAFRQMNAPTFKDALRVRKLQDLFFKP
jgi:hypothetical protein